MKYIGVLFLMICTSIAVPSYEFRQRISNDLSKEASSEYHAPLVIKKKASQFSCTQCIATLHYIWQMASHSHHNRESELMKTVKWICSSRHHNKIVNSLCHLKPNVLVHDIIKIGNLKGVCFKIKLCSRKSHI